MTNLSDSKLWVKPELIVLVRSRPEEAVLLHCKIVPDMTDKPGVNYNQGCTQGPETEKSCGNCQARAKT